MAYSNTMFNGNSSIHMSTVTCTHATTCAPTYTWPELCVIRSLQGWYGLPQGHFKDNRYSDRQIHQLLHPPQRVTQPWGGFMLGHTFLPASAWPSTNFAQHEMCRHAANKNIHFSFACKAWPWTEDYGCV
jgi:hypothetical protein